MDSRYEHISYSIRKRVLNLLGAKLDITDENGDLVFFTKMKAFKLKEDIRLFTDENMADEMIRISARNIIDFGATYDIYDSKNGDKVGALRRKGLKSILKDEWMVLDANDGEIGALKEEGLATAILSRLIGFFPQTYYIFVGGVKVCRYKRNMNPFVSKLDMDFSIDMYNKLDRRLGIAAGVLLITVEGKQD